MNSAAAQIRTEELPPLCVRAGLNKIDKEKRTVELTFTTGAAVRRYDWFNDRYYLEKLSLNPEHVRLGRIKSGAPLLDSHSAWSLSNQIGVVEDDSVTLSAKRGTAVVRFSQRAEVQPIFSDVVDRIIRNVSVGYAVYKYEETPPKKEGELPVRTAVDWEPFEISMVPMPADPGAQTRDGKSTDKPTRTFSCEIITRAPESASQETTMDETRQSETLVEQPVAGAMQLATEETRTEPNDLDRGADAERERIQGIMDACRAAKMPAVIMDRLIKDKTPLVRAQSEIFEELGKRGGSNVEIRNQTHDVRLGPDPFVHVRAGIENALQHRVAPSYFKLEDVGREYRGMSMMDIAKLYVQQAMRVRTTGMTKMEIAGLALGLNTRTGMHTTSDFALLLADVASKTLRRAYEEVPQTFLPIARRITLPDFKPSKRLQIGDAPNLIEVKEHGEFTRGTIGEGSEAMQLATYGRIFAITRQALVNDDTDAFSRVPMLFGRAARKLEADLAWAQITSNPTMGDTNALFSAAHGNLETDGDVISRIASLSMSI